VIIYHFLYSKVVQIKLVGVMENPILDTHLRAKDPSFWSGDNLILETQRTKMMLQS